MAILAVIVFIALFFFKAGYGYLSNNSWGPKINNKLAWMLMECPAFLIMAYCTLEFYSNGVDTGNDKLVLGVFAGLFLIHYFQRSFIFPLLMRGKSKMPISIMLMGSVFNMVNVYLIAGWLYSEAPAGMYTREWFITPQFIIGIILFLAGMIINLHSDYVIRNLRQPGDNKHYIPKKGLYKYVTSANYFGEITEWLGYAILTWSPAGFLFAIWTFANLCPRAKPLTEKYEEEFGDEYKALNKKHIFPFLW